MISTPRVLRALAVLLVFFAVACSGEQTLTVDGATAKESAPTVSGPDEQAVVPESGDLVATLEFGPGSDFSIVSALANVPTDFATGETGSVEIYVADLAAASSAAGIDPPSNPSDINAYGEWAQKLSGRDESPSYVKWPSAWRYSATDIAEVRDEIGFIASEVGAFVSSEVRPGSMLVVAGDVQSAASTEVSPGLHTLGDGDDFALNFETQTAARQLGIAIRVAERDDLIMYSESTDAATSWLDPSSTRLHTDELLNQAARILDQRDVFSAALYRADFSEIESPVSDTALIKTAFSTIALGWNVQDGQPVTTLVYAFDSLAAAEGAATSIEAVFTEGVTIGNQTPISDHLTLLDVSVESSAVVVSLRPVARPGVLLSMLFERDLPFLFDAG